MRTGAVFPIASPRKQHRHSMFSVGGWGFFNGPLYKNVFFVCEDDNDISGSVAWQHDLTDVVVSGTFSHKFLLTRFFKSVFKLASDNLTGSSLQSMRSQSLLPRNFAKKVCLLYNSRTLQRCSGFISQGKHLHISCYFTINRAGNRKTQATQSTLITENPLTAKVFQRQEFKSESRLNLKSLTRNTLTASTFPGACLYIPCLHSSAPVMRHIFSTVW